MIAKFVSSVLVASLIGSLFCTGHAAEAMNILHVFMTVLAALLILAMDEN